jgi:hypothetical protein
MPAIVVARTIRLATARSVPCSQGDDDDEGSNGV